MKDTPMNQDQQGQEVQTETSPSMQKSTDHNKDDCNGTGNSDKEPAVSSTSLTPASSSSCLSTTAGMGDSSSSAVITTDSDNDNAVLPEWASCLNQWGERLSVLEWDGAGPGGDVDSYRSTNGWKGSDLIHAKTSPVRVLDYRVQYPHHQSTTNDVTTSNNNEQCGSVGTKLRGIVHFTKAAESHKGYCHGGSMTSVMDDVIGWTGFCASGKCLPWSGFTVQVNTKLQKPIKVGSFLMVQCSIEAVERRKVFVKAELLDPELKNKENGGGEGCIHAQADGIIILNRGVLPLT